ncbi:MAG: acyltransferase [Bacteroidales bacterium]|nr:acyltransferase [Bacteroidales bacterium]
MSSFLSAHLYAYDKSKNLLLKATLPILIIINHVLSRIPTNGWELIEHHGGHLAMFAFFGMSGYGLMYSYLHRENYLNGFLKRSFIKLFVPYFTALILFFIFKLTQGISPIEYICNTHWLSYVTYSWFVFCLACFYLFFYIVFKFVKTQDLLKVLIVCGLVFAYVLTLKLQATFPYIYIRCLAFCVGLLIAMFDRQIRTILVRWQAWGIMVGLAILIYVLHFVYLIDSTSIWSILVTIIMFLFLYSIPSIPQTRIGNLFGSISYEMYIIQGIAIDIVLQNMGVTSFYMAIPIILVIDVVLAYAVHKIDGIIIGKISGRRE